MKASRGKFVLVAAGVATLLSLSGCSIGAPTTSSSAPPPTQASSQSEACLILQNAVSESAGDLQSAFSEVQSDPSAAVDKIQAVADALDSGASSLTNADVKAAAEQARDSMLAMVTLLDGVIADPASLDLTALQGVATQVQQDFTAIGDVCG